MPVDEEGAVEAEAEEEEAYLVTCEQESRPSLAMVRSLSKMNFEGIQRPFWRKKETVVQERTTQYITVDETGHAQELVESEVSRSEILHMECKDTGEFAHRELLTFEQSEIFNKENVVENLGYEEYVHLRSLDDETEFINSGGNVPPRARAGSPRHRAGEEGAEDFMQQGEEEHHPQQGDEEHRQYPQEGTELRREQEEATPREHSEPAWSPQDNKDGEIFCSAEADLPLAVHEYEDSTSGGEDEQERSAVLLDSFEESGPMKRFASARQLD